MFSLAKEPVSLVSVSGELTLPTARPIRNDKPLRWNEVVLSRQSQLPLSGMSVWEDESRRQTRIGMTFPESTVPLSIRLLPVVAKADEIG